MCQVNYAGPTETGIILQTVLDELKSRFSEATFNFCFSSLKITSLSDTEADLLTDNVLKKTTIMSHHWEALSGAFEKAVGHKINLNLRSRDDRPEPVKAEDDSSDYTAYKLRYNPAYTFDTFVVGSSNQVAAKTSHAVADNPAELYNPLFIYGPPGLGKTHLLFAILNRLRENFPHFNILYVTGEEFTNELVDAIVQKKNVAFREKYRKLDVLLVDDIQFIENKIQVQEEFFHTADTLFQQKKQLIITSDRPPKEINLEDRLKSRFEMGLIVDIQPPDAELRTAIFKRKSQDLGVAIPNTVLAFLAENIRTNIRQIEGAIRKLKAHSLIEGKEITLEMAVDVLGEYLRTAETADSMVAKIFDYICKKYSVKKEVLTSGKRDSDIVYVRNIAIYCIRKLTDLSLKKTGALFGRDHTTIINSITRVENRMKNETAYEREIQTVLREISE